MREKGSSLAILLEAIQEAGREVEAIRLRGYTTCYKDNASPLTEADLVANRILKERLLASYSAGWLSEETADDLERLHALHVWIVDPIDGTKEFIQNRDEYAISVALVESGKPILAAVLNPARQELFYAQKHAGAWLNGEEITANLPMQDRLTILASRTEMAEGKWAAIQARCDIKAVGSIAYKLALIAAGRGHATFSMTPKSEWDIAAGVLLVEEAGGQVTDRNGQPFTFNRTNVRVNGIIASTHASYFQLQPLLDEAILMEN